MTLLSFLQYVFSGKRTHIFILFELWHSVPHYLEGKHIKGSKARSEDHYLKSLMLLNIVIEQCSLVQDIFIFLSSIMDQHIALEKGLNLKLLPEHLVLITVKGNIMM